MEKKTIGSFIATLRKANGMTQKQLAEQLNVTDKTVSRWERDETLPDLMLILAIADVFQITADELLRGEKRTSGERECPEKKEKQILNLLAREKTRFGTRCLMTVFVGIVGAMVTIGLYGSRWNLVGFSLGVIFILGAGIVQIAYGINLAKNMELEAGDGLRGKEFAGYILKKSGLVIDLLIFCSIAVLISAGADLLIRIDWGFLIAYSVGMFCLTHLIIEMIREKIDCPAEK